MNLIKRNARKLAIVIIVFYFVAVPFLSIVILAQLKTQVSTQAAVLKQTKAIAAQLQSNSNQRTAQVATINRHLDCIVSFFSQPDRTTKAIANIDTCTLSTTQRLAVPSSSSSTGPTPPLTQPRQSGQQPSQPSNPQQPVSPQPQPSAIQQLLSGATSVGKSIRGFITGLIR